MDGTINKKKKEKKNPFLPSSNQFIELFLRATLVSRRTMAY